MGFIIFHLTYYGTVLWVRGEISIGQQIETQVYGNLGQVIRQDYLAASDGSFQYSVSEGGGKWISSTEAK